MSALAFGAQMDGTRSLQSICNPFLPLTLVQRTFTSERLTCVFGEVLADIREIHLSLASLVAPSLNTTVFNTDQLDLLRADTRLGSTLTSSERRGPEPPAETCPVGQRRRRGRTGMEQADICHNTLGATG